MLLDAAAGQPIIDQHEKHEKHEHHEKHEKNEKHVKNERYKKHVKNEKQGVGEERVVTGGEGSNVEDLISFD